jgi:hypothetical protein
MGCECVVSVTRLDLRSYKGFVSRTIYSVNLLWWMLLGLVGPRSGFNFEKFFKRFILRYQNLYIDFFYTCFDFVNYNCGDWIDNCIVL